MSQMYSYDMRKTQSLILGERCTVVVPLSSSDKKNLKYEKKISSTTKKTKHDHNKCINCEDGENTDEEPDSGVPNYPWDDV